MRPLQILFVEDSLEDVETVSYKLSKAAMEAGGAVPEVTQCNRRDRLESDLAKPWDIFLLDFNLPGFSCEETIQMMKAAQPDTPIIILTGSLDDVKAASVTVKYGACCHFNKDHQEGLPLAVQAAFNGREVRERERALQLRALRNDRLESLGDMSIGFIHDLNGILQCVLGGTEILRKLINPQDERILDLMERAAKRGAEMGKQVMTFARGSEGNALQPVAVEYLLTEMGQLLHSGAFPNIRSTIRTMPGTSKLLCDTTQIMQVLLNLCRNSRDAMPRGGEIHLSAQNVRHIEGEPIAINGNYVCVTVRDTGTGIPAEALPRIFEPYFTTKPIGAGTGMGLAMVKSIMVSHGGVVAVKSDETGTTFNIYLPAAEAVFEPAQKLADTTDGEGKTILLAEDEETVRLFLRLHLETAGYKVLCASNGPEALSKLRVGTDVDLILSDMEMPVMSGLDVARNLRAMSIDIPLILMCGRDASLPYDPKPAAILQKPFSQSLLLSTIRDVLAI